jgi:hypothetical protein
MNDSNISESSLRYKGADEPVLSFKTTVLTSKLYENRPKGILICPGCCSHLDDIY